jgi:phosphoribosylformylglycinamidine synthase PurS subunit
LRAHLNAQNPQAQGLDGQEALVTFDGPWAYVSPHWRTDLSRAATFDYEAVQVRGVVRVMSDIAFFRRQVDDLAALIEPQHADLGDYPIWNSAMTPPGYVERLFPAIVAFEIDIHAVQMISKLHQTFPEADRVRIADYLDRSHRAARARLAKNAAAARGSGVSATHCSIPGMAPVFAPIRAAGAPGALPLRACVTPAQENEIMKAIVTVGLKAGVLDVQGKAVAGALQALGFAGVHGARVGKVIELDLGDSADRAGAEGQVRDMCEKLLANTVIESYRVEIV